MRKLVLLALGIGAAVLVQRRAAKMGLLPAMILTAAAEKGINYINTINQPAPAPKPSFWQRLFPAKPTPTPKEA